MIFPLLLLLLLLHKDIILHLDLPTLQPRKRFLYASFLISVFKNKHSYSSVFDTVSLRVATRTIGTLQPLTFATVKRLVHQPDVFLQQISTDAFVFLTMNCFLWQYPKLLITLDNVQGFLHTPNVIYGIWLLLLCSLNILSSFSTSFHIFCNNASFFLQCLPVIVF